MKLVLLFLAGLFLANGVPHFINGISGRRFHSPFSNPPVKGRSSAWVNVLWGLFNFLLGSVLLRQTGGIVWGINPGAAALVSGFALAAIGLAVFFERLDKKQ